MYENFTLHQVFPCVLEKWRRGHSNWQGENPKAACLSIKESKDDKSFQTSRVTFELANGVFCVCWILSSVLYPSVLHP